MRFALALVAIVSLGQLLAACEPPTDRIPNAAPPGSTVSITDVVPSVNVPLTVGQQVTLQVSVAYALATDSGTLGLIVQDGKGTPLAHTVGVVLRGGGTEKLAASFTVPDTNAIHVFTPLSAQGQARTSTVATRSYRVQSK
jgi:hypothetical protein